MSELMLHLLHVHGGREFHAWFDDSVGKTITSAAAFSQGECQSKVMATSKGGVGEFLKISKLQGGKSMDNFET